jgi:hypothetical protein
VGETWQAYVKLFFCLLLLKYCIVYMILAEDGESLYNAEKVEHATNAGN